MTGFGFGLELMFSSLLHWIYLWLMLDLEPHGGGFGHCDFIIFFSTHAWEYCVASWMTIGWPEVKRQQIKASDCLCGPGVHGVTMNHASW